MPVELPDDWYEDEKGNTWLVDEDGMRHIAYLDVPGGRRLELEINMDNVPGLTLQLLSPEDGSDARLAAHISGRLSGWIARRCNIDGVEVGGDQQVKEAAAFTHPLAVGTRFRVDGEEQGDHDLHGDMCVDDAVWTVDKATKVNGQWEYECSTFDQNEDDAEEDRGRVRRVFEESEFEGERFHLESDDEAEDA
jgi:hypothetical protein